MSSDEFRRAGSFEALLDHHLFLFEGPVGLHLHQREPVNRHLPSKEGGGPPRPKWKTVGIFHFPAEPGEAIAGPERPRPSAG